MRAIKVTYRAVFSGPKPPISPAGWKVPGTFPIEIFGHKGHWKAREIATTKRVVYTMLMDFGNVESGKKVVEDAFEKKVQDWQIWGTPPTSNGQPARPERLLIPGVDICDLGNGEWGWYTPEDRTHIANGSTYSAKAITAVCGASVSPKIIISTKANVEPTCPQCAEVYRKEYAGR